MTLRDIINSILDYDLGELSLNLGVFIAFFVILILWPLIIILLIRRAVTTPKTSEMIICFLAAALLLILEITIIWVQFFVAHKHMQVDKA